MKYRIWNNVLGQYIDGNYHKRYFLDENGKVITAQLMFDEYSGDAPYISYSDFNQKNYTVELSTGLFDKNGKEIYEGDILALIDEYANVIDKDYCYVEMYEGSWYVNDIDDDLYELRKEYAFEVIGTCHDS